MMIIQFADFGLIGLAVMGENLVLNLEYNVIVDITTISVILQSSCY